MGVIVKVSPLISNLAFTCFLTVLGHHPHQVVLTKLNLICQKFFPLKIGSLNLMVTGSPLRIFPALLAGIVETIWGASLSASTVKAKYFLSNV